MHSAAASRGIQLCSSRQHSFINHYNRNPPPTHAHAPYRPPISKNSSSSSSSSRTAVNGSHGRQQQTASEDLELLLLQQQQHAVGPADAATALQQLVSLHQQRSQQQRRPAREPIPWQGQQPMQQAIDQALQQQELGQQLLQQATSPGTAAALTPGQACGLLHACAVLQLAPPAPSDLLLQLLHTAVPAAAVLPVCELLQLLQGAAWLLDCPHQQQQQQQNSPALSEAVQAAAPASPAPPKQQRPLSPHQQHAMLEAKRQQLLQRLSTPRQQQQQQGGQQQHSAVRQLLQEALTAWCEAQQAGLTATGAILPQQLSLLLSVLLRLRLLPGAVPLQQLLYLAGLQQQQQVWRAGDAAEVLAGLVALAQLEQDSSGTGQVLEVVQQHAQQLLLLALESPATQPAVSAGAAEQTVTTKRSPAVLQQPQQQWPGAVALTAACDLTLTSSGSSSRGPAGAAAQQQPPAVFSPLALRTAMGTLLAAVVRPAHSAPNKQRQQQQQAVLSPADVVASAAAIYQLYQHQQQQLQHQQRLFGPPADFVAAAAGSSSSSSSIPSLSGAAPDSRVVKPLRFHRWLQEYVSCGLDPRGRLLQASAPQLVSVFGLCAAAKAVMPPRWLAAAEGRVSVLLQELCAGGNNSAVAGQECAAVAKLLHSWVQLLQVQPTRRLAHASSRPSSSSSSSSSSGTAAAPPGRSDGSHTSSSSSSKKSGSSSSCSSSSSRDLYEPYFLRSSAFMRKACTYLQPMLPDMDATSLGLTAVSVAQLGVPRELQQEWTAQLLAAANAVADSAAGTAAGAGAEAQAGAPTEAQPAVPHAQAAAAAAAAAAVEPAQPAAGEQQGHRLPGEAVVQLLQSLVLLRARPPAALLQRLLRLLRRDMVLERGPVLVGLLVVLSQLQYRPGAEWLRAVLLRLQGRLRLLSFDQLTQLCWCLMLLGVQPPQHWLDDLMDAAALHIMAERSRQQQWDAWHKQQQQSQQEGEQVSAVQPARPRPGAPRVHPWQLQLMHWATLRVWRYRSSYLHGKLQWRAVRELNRAVWRQPQQRALQQLQTQWQHARSAQAGAAGRARTRRRRRMVLAGQVARLRWLVDVQKARGQAVQRSSRAWQRQQRLEREGVRASASSSSMQQQIPPWSESSSSSGSSSAALDLQQRKTGSTGSTLRRRWQLTGRARWVDPREWPKQWQLATLPSQQHQRVKGVRSQ